MVQSTESVGDHGNDGEEIRVIIQPKQNDPIAFLGVLLAQPENLGDSGRGIKVEYLTDGTISIIPRNRAVTREALVRALENLNFKVVEENSGKIDSQAAES